MNYFSLLIKLFRLKHNTKKTKEYIEKVQQKKLRKILKHSYKNSGYYRRVFEENEITEENIESIPLDKFPVINKEVFIKNFDEITTKPELTQDALREFDENSSINKKEFLKKYHVVHSSGSTGIPRYFVYDDNAWEELITGIVRGAVIDLSAKEIIKWLIDGPRILYIAATDGRYGGAMIVGDSIDGLNCKQTFLDINTPLSEWTKCVREFNPDIIIGYPSAIKILGELAEQGEAKIDVKRVISCGEPLNSGLREFFEKVFGADVLNFYGASESLALGIELNPKEGMYLFDDMNVVEVIDGKMYLTCLYNYVQPIIRYHITDQLVMKAYEKEPLYPFTQVDVLLSRNEDVLWFEDNTGKKEFLHPLAIEGFCLDGLLDYQFRQTNLDSFEMLAEVANDSIKDKIEKELLLQMQAILEEKNLGYVKFEIIFVDQIKPDPETGKKNLIVI